MTRWSVLDLVPVREGGTLRESFAASRDLAVAAEEAGCHRFWVAEHHAMDGVAGGAASVALAAIGAATSTIRIGSGGIMLPNHTPFQIAEQFGTLDALYPGRVDLGLGRAPGAGPALQRALRKDLAAAAGRFGDDVLELRALLTGDIDLPVVATPGLGAQVELWMLGSSLHGASLAARLGLPYAFASHFAPAQLDEALELYRREFTPSAALDAPRVMVAMNLFCADTREAAETLASSQWQAFAALRSGTPGRLPRPVPDYLDTLPPALRAMFAPLKEVSAIGTPDTVASAVRSFCARTRADEVIFAGATWDAQARIASLRLAMDALREASLPAPSNTRAAAA